MRVDRPEDRARLIELAYGVRRELIEFSMRVPFKAPHYVLLHPVIATLIELLEALGEQPIKLHSIRCGHTKDIDEAR
jgi:hypothetical protein